MNTKEIKTIDRKKQRKARSIKKSRLVVRNLSFKSCEEDIRNVFSQYGNVVEVNLPKKEDGKLRGFAFIAYDNVGSSLKAIKHINGKKILDRIVAVDFSVPKKIFSELNNKEDNVKQLKEEDNFNNVENEEKIDKDDFEKDDLEVEDNDIDDMEFSDGEDGKIKKNKRKYCDVLEEKTLFIRNLDLETTEESLSELLQTFGALEYCKICFDHYTEKSKGTAFAKFKNKADAQKCIKEGDIPDNPKLYLDGQQINISLALPKNKVEEIQEMKHNRHKDKRNLYLAKEGLIYPNSPASVGVSQADLKKRLMLEEKKRKLLQNYHYFISDKRLCIHNLPPNVDDKELKKLFLSAANDKKAQILWAKVMRNRSKADNKFGKSKGFGFVEFSDHSHALKTLRFLNNNPDIFTSEKRPIVEFSVENMVALNRKKFRLIKHQKMQTAKASSETPLLNDDHQNEQPEYSGVAAKPLTKFDKVIQPKFNRKMREVKKDLKKRGKEMKIESIKKQNSERHKLNLLKKNERSKKPVNIQEEDKFDEHYKKRKHIFVSNNSEKKERVIKKTKWFSK